MTSGGRPRSRDGGPWTGADLPDLSGRIYVVTGANRGIGFETALALARAHARLVLAVRNLGMGEAAALAIRREVPGASVGARQLDLADLTSVRHFTELYLNSQRALHGLINNAAVIQAPRRHLTKDGFELHWGVNHLGHFALTGLLMPALAASPGARVVTVSSLAALFSNLHFEHRGGSYSKRRTYAESKLANLVFALELARRLKFEGSGVSSLAAHPGFVDSRWTSLGPAPGSGTAPGPGALGQLFRGQSAAAGALPSLFAVAAPEAGNGGFYGPAHLFGTRGGPRSARRFRGSRSRELAERLWLESERATGVDYHLARAPH